MLRRIDDVWYNETYPLVRFGTGDLSYLSDEPCACGRTSPQLMRIVGRVGEAVKIRAMFVHPKQVKEVIASFPQVTKYQLIVDHIQQKDVTTLKLEVAEGVSDREELSRGIQNYFPQLCTVKVDKIEFVTPGTIPAEAKIIVDQRKWE